MKYSNLPAFEKHLESASPNHFSDIYLILAKEAFVRKRAADRLKELVLKNESSPELSCQILDAEKHTVGNVLSELQGISFFSKKRLVIVHNVDAYDKASTLKLEAYCSSPNQTVCFVVTASTLNRATTFYKKLEKAGIVLDVAEEKTWEKEKIIIDWVHTEAAREGKQLGPQVAQMLVKQLGTDQMLLTCELQKLICYVGERKTIIENDVAAISSVANLENGWQLGEAIFRRDAASAIRISKGLLMEGTALIALLRQVRSQFQIEYQVCSILSQGGNVVEVSKEFPYMKGTILDRHIKQAQAYGMPRFKQAMLAIDEAEIQAKNSSMDPEFLAERLMIKLTL